MHLSRIVQLSSSPPWLLLTVIVLTGLLWLIFVRGFPLSDIAWKRVDYIWLSIALLGVLASSGRASHEFTKAEIQFLGPVTNFSFQTLRRDIEFGANPGSEGCAPRIHTSFSPPDYDDIRKAQQHLCEQFRKLDSEVQKSPALGDTKFAALDQLNFQPLSEDELSLKYERREIELLKADAARYEKDRQVYNAKLEEERNQEVSPLILMDLGIGPLLVGLAIAIRLTKTAGEIRNKKEVGSQTEASKSGKPTAETSKTLGAKSEPKALVPTPIPPTAAPPEPKIETRTSAPPPVQPTATGPQTNSEMKAPESAESNPPK
jgi:hypothetical protein